MSVTIEQHQKRLEKLSIAELRLEYEKVFGEITTARHARHIIKRILWQMQANLYGGLSQDTLKRANELADLNRLRITSPRLKPPSKNAQTVSRPLPQAITGNQSDIASGTQLERMYKGQRIVATIMENGVRWEHSRLQVASPKTARHAGHESRLVPLFPELRPFLEAVWDAAEPGQKHIITRYRNPGGNMRTQLARIVKRAGLEPWPRIFHNLRSSRQTELEETFPSHVVCKWIGNSPQVARKHYLQLTDEHFRRAIESETKSGAKSGAARARGGSRQVASRGCCAFTSPCTQGRCATSGASMRQGAK